MFADELAAEQGTGEMPRGVEGQWDTLQREESLHSALHVDCIDVAAFAQQRCDTMCLQVHTRQSDVMLLWSRCRAFIVTRTLTGTESDKPLNRKNTLQSQGSKVDEHRSAQTGLREKAWDRAPRRREARV